MLPIETVVLEGPSIQTEIEVAKKAKKKIVRREYTKADVKELRAHSKAMTAIAKIMKLTKERKALCGKRRSSLASVSGIAGNGTINA